MRSNARLAVVDWAKYRSEDSKFNDAGEALAKRLDETERMIIEASNQRVKLMRAERLASGRYHVDKYADDPEPTRTRDEIQADEAGMPRFGPI